MEQKTDEKEKEKSPADINTGIYHYGMYSACYFALISQERLKTSTLENMNNQAEADLQKANQSLNMTLDKYETLLYAITTDGEFLSLVVNANDSEEIPEADAYNMRRDFPISVIEMKELTESSLCFQTRGGYFTTDCRHLR